jgi:F-type H+-transporting ATPase subunit c
MKLIKSIILAGAFVLLAHGTVYAQGTKPAAAPFSDLKAIGAGIVTLGAALGIGMLAKGAFESMARQPEIEANIRGAMIIVAAFIEGFTFFALLIILLQVLGFGV